MAGNVAGSEAVVQAITGMLQTHLGTYLAAIEAAASLSLNIAAPHASLGYAGDMTTPPHDRTNWIAVDVDREDGAQEYLSYDAPIDESQEYVIRWTFDTEHLDELGKRRRVMARAVHKVLREQWFTYDGNSACILDLTTSADHRELALRLAAESVPGLGSAGPRTGNNLESITVRARIKQRVANNIA